MKAPALLRRSERATRPERVAKPPFVAPVAASKDPDPIDEQIASLLESVSSDNEAQAAVLNRDVGPDRVTATDGPPATAIPEAPRPRRRARISQTRPARARPAVSETVKDTLSGLASELPRPYRSYTVRIAFAIALFSIAVAFLIVYLMSALARGLG
jgi:hypothetical protein